jgi:glycosyltransferase involved in cell wall biosynthesis
MSSTATKPSSNESELLSVVIPAYNEELVIDETISRIVKILDLNDISREILVINDGSTDGTLDKLTKLKNQHGIRILCLSTNSGHMSAIRAGLEASKGDYVLTIDADLQDPPEAIPEMFRIISSSHLQSENETGSRATTYDVVQAFRSDRKSDTYWKRKCASLYYKIIKNITGITLVPHAADYRIMKKHVVKTLIALPEQNLVFRLLIPSLGFKISHFPIARDRRFAGKSKYTYRKMIGLALDSVIGFTSRPLRLLALVGISSSILLFLGSIITLCIYLFGNTIPGWPSLVLLILSFNAFLFAGLGLVGEYVGRIYVLAQNRPTTPWTEI